MLRESYKVWAMTRKLTKKEVDRKRKKAQRPGASTVFLPDYPEQVKAIAMRGLSDDEMAEVFGISPSLMKAWKQFYPSFAVAIDKGRTGADARVVQALFDKAIGYDHPEEKIHFDSDGDVHTYDTTKRYPPDTAAIKLWLTNRQKEHFTERTEQRHGIADNAVPGVRDETKREVMASILSLIMPKGDPKDPEPKDDKK